MSDEIRWHEKSRALSSLRGYDKNPRKATKAQLDQLKASILKFGCVDQPLINLDDTIICGHQRIAIMKQLGFETIPVKTPSRMLTAKEVEELNIRHNQNRCSWDYDILANQFEMNDLVAWGFSEAALLEEELPKKEKKPKATFEFPNKEILIEASELLQELATTWEAKLKLTGYEPKG